MRVTLNDAELDRLLRSRAGPVVREITRVARRVQNRARHNCPVDTGRLRASIHTTISIQSRAVTATVSTPVHYAPYVELGTRRMRAKPYLVPALERESPWPVQRYTT